MRLPTQTLYEQDFNLWAEAQLAALREQRYSDLDLPNLLEEIAGLTRSDKRALRSHLRVLLMHLLKWQFQADRQSSSWRSSIVNARLEIAEIVDDSPSLNHYLPEIFPKAYADARRQAAEETQLPLTRFPLECPYELEQTLTEGYYPD